MSTSESLAQL